MARHGPEKGVESCSLLTKEIPGSVMGCGTLGNLVVGVGLDAVNEIREVNGILDEEHGHIVSHNIKVAFISVPVIRLAFKTLSSTLSWYSQSHGEAMDVSCCVGTATRARNC